MSEWWRAVDDELKRLSDTAPDPWGGIDLPASNAALTPEQRAFLAQLSDAPIAHLDADDFAGENFDDDLDDDLKSGPTL